MRHRNYCKPAECARFEPASVANLPVMRAVKRATVLLSGLSSASICTFMPQSQQRKVQRASWSFIPGMFVTSQPCNRSYPVDLSCRGHSIVHDRLVCGFVSRMPPRSKHSVWASIGSDCAPTRWSCRLCVRQERAVSKGRAVCYAWHLTRGGVSRAERVRFRSAGCQ